MTIKETAKYRILANAVQNSFGKSSLAKYSSHYVKAEVVSDEHVKFMCNTTITFEHENMFIEMRKGHIEECIGLISQFAQKIEKEYARLVAEKASLLEPKVEPYEKAAPKTIKLKIMSQSVQDHKEILSYSIYNPKKTALFKVQLLAKIS
jgi:hypothetical protein